MNIEEIEKKLRDEDLDVLLNLHYNHAIDYFLYTKEADYNIVELVEKEITRRVDGD